MYKDFVMGSEKNVLNTKVCCDQIKFWNATLDNAVIPLGKKFLFAYYVYINVALDPILNEVNLFNGSTLFIEDRV
jgi:hypothetical protein